ncbi:hypothetical protein D6821_01890 [Candidatus Parcubacteria bacterium]|nr:MAG: hypothetical protein D6821_01890 [Candidatus Parcubacteria bacterium]
MNRKFLGLGIILLGLAALGGALYFMFGPTLFNKPSAPSPSQPSNSQPQAVEPSTNQETNKEIGPMADFSQRRSLNLSEFSATPQKGDNEEDEGVQPKESSAEISPAELARMATAFAERFGSYSNHSNFANIRDLKMFMSKKMRRWADEFIAEKSKQRPDPAIYYGISTKALSYQVQDFDNEQGKANILVVTQRRESTGTFKNATFFTQNILITFVKEGGAWKVDSAAWQ